ncbi:hypothetical protein ACMFMG_011617 [Clarireedia jacksonii]
MFYGPGALQSEDDAHGYRREDSSNEELFLNILYRVTDATPVSHAYKKAPHLLKPRSASSHLPRVTTDDKTVVCSKSNPDVRSCPGKQELQQQYDLSSITTARNLAEKANQLPDPFTGSSLEDEDYDEIEFCPTISASMGQHLANEKLDGALNQIHEGEFHPTACPLFMGLDLMKEAQEMRNRIPVLYRVPSIPDMEEFLKQAEEDEVVTNTVNETGIEDKIGSLEEEFSEDCAQNCKQEWKNSENKDEDSTESTKSEAIYILVKLGVMDESFLASIDRKEVINHIDENEVIDLIDNMMYSLEFQTKNMGEDILETEQDENIDVNDGRGDLDEKVEEHSVPNLDPPQYLESKTLFSHNELACDEDESGECMVWCKGAKGACYGRGEREEPNGDHGSRSSVEILSDQCIQENRCKEGNEDRRRLYASGSVLQNSESHLFSIQRKRDADKLLTSRERIGFPLQEVTETQANVLHHGSMTPNSSMELSKGNDIFKWSTGATKDFDKCIMGYEHRLRGRQNSEFIGECKEVVQLESQEVEATTFFETNYTPISSIELSKKNIGQGMEASMTNYTPTSSIELSKKNIGQGMEASMKHREKNAQSIEPVFLARQTTKATQCLKNTHQLPIAHVEAQGLTATELYEKELANARPKQSKVALVLGVVAAGGLLALLWIVEQEKVWRSLIVSEELTS